MPRVKIIATGGTIASKTDPETGKAVPALTGEDLVEAVPGLADVATVEVEQAANVLGHTMSIDTVFDIARRAVQCARDGEWDGVVVLHGTATMEESVFMADMLHTGDRPIVYTGAMYSAQFKDSDGPRNILNAVKVAAAPEARGKGALVAMNAEIHAARDVTKQYTSSTNAFTSVEHGIVGYVDIDRVVFYREPIYRLPLDVDRIVIPVDLIKLVAGMDGRLIVASADSGAQAIVLEALPGRGSVSLPAVPGIAEVRNRGLPVVIAPTCLGGRVYGGVSGYGGGSGSRDMLELGCLFTGDLQPKKARIFMMAALAVTRDLQELQAMLDRIAP